jgi:pimeloyl-ACP methyl ester carboxylesterase
MPSLEKDHARDMPSSQAGAAPPPLPQVHSLPNDYVLHRYGYNGRNRPALSISVAALVAAAAQGNDVKAVVSRGGRPDSADRTLPLVRAATLLIVGGDDEPVVELNRRALARMQCEKQLKIIPGATHLFSKACTMRQIGLESARRHQRFLHERQRACPGADCNCEVAAGIA